MNIIEKLEEKFTKLPGIGPRQAKRFVFYLLTRSDTFIDELVYLLKNLKKESKKCSFCMRFFGKEYENEAELCPICLDRNRDDSTLMIVSKDVDIETIERSGIYNGIYFVIGGILPVLEKDPKRILKVDELGKRINEKCRNGVIKEVVIALPASPDGDNTADYIRKFLVGIDCDFKISQLGRGLSTGLEIEYSDSETIKNALKGRV